MLVAGSATPRPESFERLERIVLPERVDGRGLPPVEVVGMLDAPGPLHPRTRDALEAVRRGEEKAIVLLNRRGWSNFLSCQVCGRVWKCPQCDVSLVLHRAAGTVACHHCGHREHGAGLVPRLRLDVGRAPRARHRAARARARGADEAAAGHPAGRRRGEGGGDAAAIRRRARRRAGRHADGRQGPRLPGRHARRRRGRRLHAALSRLPRRGAHVRARRAARRPQRARAARREGDRADRRPVGATACATRPRTTPRRSSPRSSRAGSSCRIRRSPR